jgi:hypothetical protein
MKSYADQLGKIVLSRCGIYLQKARADTVVARAGLLD